MAFSSGSRRGLPLKNKGKRRRSPLGDFVRKNTNLTIILLSAILLIGALLHYGIPNPLSSSKTSNSTKFRSPKKSAGRTLTSSVGFNLSEAKVDITTKDLYDKIEFLDIDGGPWKQGWRVNYRGNEWDSEKLKVFVIPHSHNDPGWILTVEEYYLQKTRYILDAVVHALLKVIWKQTI